MITPYKIKFDIEIELFNDNNTKIQFSKHLVNNVLRDIDYNGRLTENDAYVYIKDCPKSQNQKLINLLKILLS